jgi:CTP-dependent riboflavin kinase
MECMKIEGVVVSGRGSSSRWMPTYLPNLYPGTLNIKLKSPKPNIIWETIIKVDHWRGDWKEIKLSKCLINDLEAYIVSPPRADFKPAKPFFLEIAAREKLRDKFNLTDHSTVEITFLNT